MNTTSVLALIRSFGDTHFGLLGRNADRFRLFRHRALRNFAYRWRNVNETLVAGQLSQDHFRRVDPFVAFILEVNKTLPEAKRGVYAYLHAFQIEHFELGRGSLLQSLVNKLLSGQRRAASRRKRSHR